MKPGVRQQIQTSKHREASSSNSIFGQMIMLYMFRVCIALSVVQLTFMLICLALQLYIGYLIYAEVAITLCENKVLFVNNCYYFTYIAVSVEHLSLLIAVYVEYKSSDWPIREIPLTLLAESDYLNFMLNGQQSYFAHIFLESTLFVTLFCFPQAFVRLVVASSSVNMNKA